MLWRSPLYLWIEVLPGLLILGWLLSEARRRRRLMNFGDPEILGISTPWISRVAALLLLISGIAGAAAVIALPERKEIKTPRAAPGIQILVDMQSLESGEEQLWENFDIALQSILDQAHGMLVSAATAGSTGEVVVYPTEDAKGLQIILSRLRFAPRSEVAINLAQALDKQTGLQKVQAPEMRFVVVTGAPSDEVERLAIALKDKVANLIFVSISTGSRPVQFGAGAPDGSLVWTSMASDIQRYLKPNPDGARVNARIELTQWFALAALVLLCAEFLISLSARLCIGRKPRG
jgi:hypothetical protein